MTLPTDVFDGWSATCPVCRHHEVDDRAALIVLLDQKCPACGAMEDDMVLHPLIRVAAEQAARRMFFEDRLTEILEGDRADWLIEHDTPHPFGVWIRSLEPSDLDIIAIEDSLGRELTPEEAHQWEVVWRHELARLLREETP